MQHRHVNCWPLAAIFPAITSSVDPDQLAHEGAIWSGSILLDIHVANFNQTVMSKILIGQKSPIGRTSEFMLRVILFTSKYYRKKILFWNLADFNQICVWVFGNVFAWFCFLLLCATWAWKGPDCLLKKYHRKCIIGYSQCSEWAMPCRFGDPVC